MRRKLNISALSLVPIKEKGSVKDAFNDMIALARYLDDSTFQRLWIAEHHNTTSLASSATKQLIHHALHYTNRIRIGSGGVMLPNHSPLIVAEAFGTLHAIFGDRIDIGLGRAPGTDMKTARAIRRNSHDGVFHFKDEVQELRDYLHDGHDSVIAFPGQNTQIPIYILGSSTDSAHLAASLGLPYAFAGHFAPKEMKEAFHIYNTEFKPSDALKMPYTIACLNVVMADTDEEAAHLSTTLSQFILNVVRNSREELKPPVDSMDGLWSETEEYIVKSRFPTALLGNKKTVLENLRYFQSQYNVDEIMAVTYIYSNDALLHSYRLFEETVQEWNG